MLEQLNQGMVRQVTPAEQSGWAYRWFGCGKSQLPDRWDDPYIYEIWKRHETLCKELGDGKQSRLIRSWLMLFFFCGGLSLAPCADRALLPPLYPDEKIGRYDRGLAVVVLLLVVLGVRLNRNMGR